MDRPCPYDLPAMKYITSKEVTMEGRKMPLRGIYVAWFVADNDELTADHWQRMWWLARDLVRNGVLQRWALVDLFQRVRARAGGRHIRADEEVYRGHGAGVPTGSRGQRNAAVTSLP